jgi:hypothetical protein
LKTILLINKDFIKYWPGNFMGDGGSGAIQDFTPDKEKARTAPGAIPT